MNSYGNILNANHFEIGEILKNCSKEINKKHFEFLMLLVKLFDNLISFEEFEEFYDELFKGLTENDINLLDKIFKLEIKDIIEFKDKNNLWVKKKNTQKRKEMI